MYFPLLERSIADEAASNLFQSFVFLSKAAVLIILGAHLSFHILIRCDGRAIDAFYDRGAPTF